MILPINVFHLFEFYLVPVSAMINLGGLDCLEKVYSIKSMHSFTVNTAHNHQIFKVAQ